MYMSCLLGNMYDSLVCGKINTRITKIFMSRLQHDIKEN